LVLILKIKKVHIMNLKKIIRCIVIGALFLLPVGSAAAIEISLSPSTQNVTLGDTVNVDVDITGLGDGAPLSLSIFDLDVTFDSSILDFNSVVFGDPVLGDQLDLFGLGGFTDVLPGAGFVNLFELSFDFASDLDTLQFGDFTLATLTFDSLAAGTSALDIFVNDLGDADGLPLTATTTGASVEVIKDTTSTPEPSTIILLGLGMTALIFGRRRKQ